eukprot:TRINITY_DN3306_c0_g1_i1.p1 TRINITY_DN3306_c0_g1~~TRINITY_DN3306_c0_g1_i1.p1  ORF type:complete len:508 (+),score=150.36 TRINITY_DN3306_c0_g1_i1:163-1686(+)
MMANLNLMRSTISGSSFRSIHPKYQFQCVDSTRWNGIRAILTSNKKPTSRILASPSMTKKIALGFPKVKNSSIERFNLDRKISPLRIKPDNLPKILVLAKTKSGSFLLNKIMERSPHLVPSLFFKSLKGKAFIDYSTHHHAYQVVKNCLKLVNEEKIEGIISDVCLNKKLFEVLSENEYGIHILEVLMLRDLSSFVKRITSIADSDIGSQMMVRLIESNSNNITNLMTIEEEFQEGISNHLFDENTHIVIDKLLEMIPWSQLSDGIKKKLLNPSIIKKLIKAKRMHTLKFIVIGGIGQLNEFIVPFASSKEGSLILCQAIEDNESAAASISRILFPNLLQFADNKNVASVYLQLIKHRPKEELKNVWGVIKDSETLEELLDDELSRSIVKSLFMKNPKATSHLQIIPLSLHPEMTDEILNLSKEYSDHVCQEIMGQLVALSNDENGAKVIEKVIDLSSTVKSRKLIAQFVQDYMEKKDEMKYGKQILDIVENKDTDCSTVANYYFKK